MTIRHPATMPFVCDTATACCYVFGVKAHVFKESEDSQGHHKCIWLYHVRKHIYIICIQSHALFKNQNTRTINIHSISMNILFTSNDAWFIYENKRIINIYIICMNISSLSFIISKKRGRDVMEEHRMFVILRGWLPQKQEFSLFF